MSSSKYHSAVFFDFDGVIFDTESYYLDIMTSYNKKIELPLTKEQYIEHVLGRTQNDINSYFKELWGNLYSDTEYWEGLLSYRKEQLISSPPKLKKGFCNLFKYLKQNNYYVGIVSSNSLNLIQMLLTQAGVCVDDFNCVITRESAIRVKPFPDLYELALDRAKISRNNCFAIEDSLIGVSAAVAAGVNTIHLLGIDTIPIQIEHQCILTMKSLSAVHSFFSTR